MGAAEETKTDPPSLMQILEKAGASAVRGGTAGAVAMGMNVGLLMWMRTTVRIIISSLLSSCWLARKPLLIAVPSSSSTGQLSIQTWHFLPSGTKDDLCRWWHPSVLSWRHSRLGPRSVIEVWRYRRKHGHADLVGFVRCHERFERGVQDCCRKCCSGSFSNCPNAGGMYLLNLFVAALIYYLVSSVLI